MSGTERALPPAARNGYLAKFGILGFALTKLKLVKLALVAASFAAYADLLNWQTAVVLIVGLCVHEMGHVWAMRRVGIKTSGFYLIPFVGGICSPQRPFQHRFEEAFVAIMGPVFGLFSLPVCFIAGYAMTSSFWQAADLTAFIAFINLFNMLPIVPLDGGRVLRAAISSFSRGLGIMMVGSGVVAAVYLAWFLHMDILVFVAFLALMELSASIRSRQLVTSLNARSAFAWIGVYVVMVGVLSLCGFGLTGYATYDHLGCAGVSGLTQHVFCGLPAR